MAIPVKVFLSYSHKDKSYKDRLDTHFTQMKRTKQITIWNDCELSAGDDFDKEIADQITTADLIIMLISADFLESSYCYDKELKTALRRHKKNEALAIGVVVSHCDWETSPLRQYQLLPRNAEPIISYPENEHESIYLEIVNGVKDAIKKFKRQKSTGKTGEITRRSGIKMVLPINNVVRINSDFFVAISEFTHSLCTFLPRTEKIIAENAKNYTSYKCQLTKTSDLLTWDMLSLQIFLQQLCREINIIFFKYGGVRTHISYLHIMEKKYFKLAAAYDSVYYEDDMEPIPWTDSMIYASEIHKTSLLRSLNPEFHYGKDPEESNFKDYLTFTFLDESFCSNGHCLLSMGISFEEPEQYKNLIYHLNFCAFEIIIMDIVKKFSAVTKIDVVNTILGNQD